MPNWTRERPTEAGWYWVWVRGLDPFVVEVIHDEQLDALVVDAARGELLLEDYDRPLLQWAGPLTPPPLEEA